MAQPPPPPPPPPQQQQQQWREKLAKEVLRTPRRRFPRRMIFSPSVDDCWTADLMDAKKWMSVNRQYRYILCVLDVFSRFCWARALKQKNAEALLSAFRSILNGGNKPKRIYCDKGGEFYNNSVEDLFHRHNIELYSTHNEPKAAISERFIRTLRRKLNTHFIMTDSTVWYNALNDIINVYNNTKHRTLKMTPTEARSPNNFITVYRNQFHRKTENKVKTCQPRFFPGLRVRISLHRRLFDKDADSAFSEEIFRISSIVPGCPAMYKIEDLAGEPIKGSFYEKQLQITEQTTFRVAKILRKRKVRGGKEQVLVRWFGYPKKFDSWEDSDQLLINRQV